MLATILLQALFLYSGQNTVDVCSVSNIKSSQAVYLRGTGGKSPEGPLLFDYTCPAGSGNDFVLPTVVLLGSPTFDSPELKERFRLLSEKSIFQAIVSGRLECQKSFKIGKSDDGDIVYGNGYGPSSLYKCRMRESRFVMLHKIDTE